MSALPQEAPARRRAAPPRARHAAPPVRRADGAPHLRVVRRRAPRWPWRTAALVVAGTSLLGIVALNALAAEAAFTARELSAEVADLRLRHDELVVDVARLSAPLRLETIATRELGMVPAAAPAFLVVDPSAHSGVGAAKPTLPADG